MGLSKHQKTKVVISISISFLFLIGVLIVFYYSFLYFKISLYYFVALSIIIISSASTGSYIGIRNLSAGKDITFFFEFKWQDRYIKILFWFISPLIFLTFCYIYTFPIVFLTSLLSLPFKRLFHLYSDIIDKVNLGIILFFALSTVLWLWRLLKSNYFDKIKEPQKNA